MDFSTLVRVSDAIVLGRVVDVSKVKGVKIARVKVLETVPRHYSERTGNGSCSREFDAQNGCWLPCVGHLGCAGVSSVDRMNHTPVLRLRKGRFPTPTQAARS
jgi:hypothetical protein